MDRYYLSFRYFASVLAFSIIRAYNYFIMEVFLKGHDYRYAAEQMLLTLYPEERPVYPPAPEGGDSVVLASAGGRRMPA